MLEPVNIRVDHPGSCWTAPHRPRRQLAELRWVLYDLYHSTVEGEDVAAELAAAGDLIKYVQLADAPGRVSSTGLIDRKACRPARRRLHRP